MCRQSFVFTPFTSKTSLPLRSGPSRLLHCCTKVERWPALAQIDIYISLKIMSPSSFQERRLLINAQVCFACDRCHVLFDTLYLVASVEGLRSLVRPCSVFLSFNLFFIHNIYNHDVYSLTSVSPRPFTPVLHISSPIHLSRHHG